MFDAEPGEADYNPLWDEVWVTWKEGVKAVLLTQDDQIASLAAEGKLTLTDAGRSYVEACKRIIEQVDDAEKEVSGEYRAPTVV